MRALALVGLLLGAGCSSPAPLAPGPGEAGLAAQGSQPFALSGEDCFAGGGHSVHPKLPGYLPEPWQMADVQEDTGTPPLTTEPYAHPTEPTPRANHTMGNWHVTVSCMQWDFDGEALGGHVFGYVGMRVEPPPFDDGPTAERHYLVTVVASSDSGVRDALHGLGVHASDATGSIAMGSDGIVRQVLDTSDHGVYESMFLPEDAGHMPATFRLWFQAQREDGTFRPVALDVHNEGGERLRARLWYGTFSHLETSDHAPLPGAAGESPAVAYTGFTHVLRPGPAPDVALAEAYIHR